jgi:hypothetical protein
METLGVGIAPPAKAGEDTNLGFPAPRVNDGAVNAYSGIVNTDSGHHQNRSRSARNTVHDQQKSLFTIPENHCS